MAIDVMQLHKHSKLFVDKFGSYRNKQDVVTIAGHEVVYDGVLICPGDQTGVTLTFTYGHQSRTFLISFCSTWNGPAGVWVHNHLEYKYTSILFAKWGSGSETERILNPPVRFCDIDGQRFEIAVSHKKISDVHRAAVQITAVPFHYGGPFTRALYASDQPPNLKLQ